MKYATAQAFRQALEERIRREYKGKNIPRIRKMIAFERLMARLDERWILKGGYAIQLRTEKARTTQDVDLMVFEIPLREIEDSFRKALDQNIGDHFEFFTSEQGSIREDVDSARFQVTARVAGRIFERFHVDVGFSDPLFQPVEYLVPPNYLAFAQIATFTIPCYSIYQHIAEKVHAIWRPRKVQSSRVKDLVDLAIELFSERENYSLQGLTGEDNFAVRQIKIGDNAVYGIQTRDERENNFESFGQVPFVVNTKSSK